MKLVSDGKCEPLGMLKRSEFDFWNVEITGGEIVDLRLYHISSTLLLFRQNEKLTSRR